MTNGVPLGPVQSESTPTQQTPQTAPRLPNFADERDSTHLFTVVSGLREKTGELNASIVALNVSAGEVRGDIKEMDSRLSDLRIEQVSTAKSIKVLAYFATPLLGIVAWFAPSYWQTAMRPEMEKTIAAQVKADIEKEQAAREKTRALESQISDLQSQLRQQRGK